MANALSKPAPKKVVQKKVAQKKVVQKKVVQKKVVQKKVVQKKRVVKKGVGRKNTGQSKTGKQASEDVIILKNVWKIFGMAAGENTQKGGNHETIYHLSGGHDGSHVYGKCTG
ncbi:MAG: hypothetical protein ISP40_04765 [Alphaproteobacteria bacterium]|nr:hypothetical protein [Alphaproteobacteria bacterium]